ncbi:MAG: glucosamine-6-phosphate deaminase [Clostridiales bacterium]|nr:glucosamine-6-phosphate deaminase [Clostridiales bacterium]
MQIHIFKDAAQIGEAAAQLFAAKLLQKPDCVLGLATGSTPLPTYDALVALHRRGLADFSRVRSFNLDEYVGIDRAHEQSYYRFMYDNLFSLVNIKPENVQVPHPVSEDLGADCDAYEAAIDAAGGIDLQILGIGNNGHIAFNEPCEVFPLRTHIVHLTESTILANQRFFNSADEVPRQAMTMGIGTILRAREILLIATGAGKAAAVAAMVNGNADPRCPASALHLHSHVTVFLDAGAALIL